MANHSSLQVINHKMPLLAGNRPSFACSVGDIGNATCTLVTPESIVTMPHAIRELADSEVAQIKDEGNENENIYWVNGTPYELGFAAQREGKFALKFGSMRFTPEYIGAIYAILMFNAYAKPAPHNLVLANHPPRDARYRPNIINAVQGTFEVVHGDKTKVFVIDRVGCYYEPVGGYLNAICNEEGKVATAHPLRVGNWLIIDIGGFTTDFALVKDGVINTTPAACKSLTYGMLTILQSFENAVRDANPDFFMPIQFSDEALWRGAFETGIYNGRALGEVVCSEQVHNVGREAVKTIMKAVDNEMGGLGNVEGIVLSGGGGAKTALGRFFTKDLIQEAKLEYSEANQTLMHLSTALGAAKQAAAANAKKLLWKTEG